MPDPYDPAAHDGRAHDPRAQEHREPAGKVQVIPRLSAPIDEGVFYPHPAPTLWDRTVRIAIFAIMTIIAVAAVLSRGTFFLR